MNMVYVGFGVAALVLVGLATLSGGQQDQGKKRVYGGLVVDEVSPKRKDKLTLTDAEWQKRLSPEQYRILRSKGTEAAFCSTLNDVHKAGVFHCAGCDLELFSTDAKFTSGTGWPSFFQPVKRENVWLKSDYSYGMDRIEVLCSRCDGHLGHIFNDGPREKTGNRFCINGESLVFKETK